MIKTKLKYNRGTSIIETLFYIVLFTILSFAIISALMTMMKSFKDVSIQRELASSGTVMEAISREIKKANGINSLPPPYNDLTLNTKDDSGNAKTVQFVLSGTDVLFKENNILTGNLNSPNINISNLSFVEINLADGKAIKISFSVSSKSDSSRVENYYDTVVLRGSY